MMSRPKIAFQGEPGANSDEACRTYFPDYEPQPCASFEDAFEAVKSGACALALIPVENSLAGRVPDVHHLLPGSGLRIIGERFKPIHFHLMANRGVKLEDVRVVSSMPIALGQCRKLIKQLKARTEGAADTAGAAKLLAEHPDPAKAALAPALAAELYGLDILASNVEDSPDNTTRFLVMTAEANPAPPTKGPYVTSFVFRVKNAAGALYNVLRGFAERGVNITKIESYMEDGSFTATMFFVEVDGRPEDPALDLAIKEMGVFSERFEILGVYAADPFRAQRGAT